MKQVKILGSNFNQLNQSNFVGGGGGAKSILQAKYTAPNFLAGKQI
jgi:hypothetical protein